MTLTFILGHGVQESQNFYADSIAKFSIDPDLN